MIELNYPSVSNTKPGATEWSMFQIDAANELVVEDGSFIPTRRWVVYQDPVDATYYVALWDGTLFVSSI
jgi:hypothetical protein